MSIIITIEHQGKMCCGRTPMATLLDGKRIWVEKNKPEINLTDTVLKTGTVRLGLIFYSKC